MLWQLKNLVDNIKHREKLKKCERCGLLTLKSNEKCIQCNGIDDQKLKDLLKKRNKLRLSLGQGMFIGALLLFSLLLIL